MFVFSAFLPFRSLCTLVRSLYRLDSPSSLRREGTSREILPLGEVLQSLSVPRLAPSAEAVSLGCCGAQELAQRSGGVSAVPRGRMSWRCSHCCSPAAQGASGSLCHKGASLARAQLVCWDPRSLSAETLWHLG